MRFLGWAATAAAVLLGCGGSGGAGGPAADAGVPVDASAADDASGAPPSPVDAAPLPVDRSPLEGAWVAFSSNRDGSWDVFAVRPDGSGLRKLVGGPGAQRRPRWSPNGRALYFLDDVSGASRLKRLDLETGTIADVEVTGVPAVFSPAIAPDGQSFAFVTNGGKAIYTVPAGGGAATAVHETTASAGSPSYHPDGTIAFVSDQSGTFEIWQTVTGAAARQLSTNLQVLGGIEVGPDGRTIAITRRANGTSAAAEFTVEGQKVRVLSAESDSEPSFARDGRRVALTTYRWGERNAELVAYDAADGAGLVRLTNHPALDAEPQFRP